MSEQSERTTDGPDAQPTHKPVAENAGAPQVRGRRRWLRPVLLIAGPVAVIVGGAWWYYSGGRYVETENAYVHASMVAVSPRVNGSVVEVDVQENEAVAAGDILFRIDPRPFQIAVDRAQANLENVRQDLQALKDTYAQQNSSLELARINLDYAQRNFDRRSKLSETNVVSDAQLDEARNALDAARQQVVVDRKAMQTTLAKLGGSIDTPIEKAPAYRQADAQLAQARLDLAHTAVEAPFDGIVTNKPEPGTYVSPGSAVMSLVSSRDLWVEANYKEIDLTHVTPGQSVDITVDTFPDRVWHGTVSSLAPATGSELSVLPAQNATGNWVKVVQRIPVRIAVTQEDGLPPLRAGMSTEVEIDTHHRRELPGFARTVLSWLGSAEPAASARAAPADTVADVAR